MTTPAPPSLRSLKSQARDLLDEAERLRKRHHKEIPEAIDREIDDAMGPVRVALGEESPPVKGFEQAVSQLDALLEKHLGDKRKSIVREYVESIILAVVIALFIRTFFVEAFKIPTGSMIPTLQINDHIFVNKMVYGVRKPFDPMTRWLAYDTPSVGDVVVFEFPSSRAQPTGWSERMKEGALDILETLDLFDFFEFRTRQGDEGKDFIKRIVGVAGDRVRLLKNHVVINDVPVKRTLVEPESPCHSGECRCSIWEETFDDAPHSAQHIHLPTLKTRAGDTLDSLARDLEWTPRQLAQWNRRTLTSAGISGPAGAHTPLPEGLVLDVGRRGCAALARSATWPLDTCADPGSPCIGGKAIRDAISGDAGSLNVTVPEGHVLAFGDNRDNSHDGRYWGFVPVSHIKGRAMFIWLANDKSRIFDAIP